MAGFRSFEPLPRLAARGGKRGGTLASLTAHQNQSAEALAGLAPLACQPGGLPGAFRSLARWDEQSPGVLGA